MTQNLENDKLEHDTMTEAFDDRNNKRVVWRVIGMVAILLISILSYIQYSRSATEDAAHNVSLFYLEELDSNVTQVFQSHFDGYFKELKLALLATKEAETDSKRELENHMDTMADRGGFAYYALMDEDGNIYINDASYKSQYLVDFLHECDLAQENVTIENRHAENEDLEDVFIIAQAAPEGLAVMNGKKIVLGAKGISADKVRKEILLRGEDNDAFVHMITSDGDYVIAGDNEKLVKSDNYFTDLANVAEFNNYSLEDMIDDIQNQHDDSTAYYIDGERYYGYYSFLPRSGWSLVVTVPFDTIMGTMEKTANRVTFGGIFVMMLMVIVLAVIFVIFIRQRNTSLKLNMQRIEAEERNLAKSTFLSSMSHDIRTPMNAIIGFTNLALRQENSPRVQEYLSKISTSSNHLLSLINDVLDMSRIESGKMNIEWTKCNLSEILHGLQTIMQGQVTAKQQHLHMDVLDVVNENVWCDKMRMNQVLLNFLSNAVKFTPAGGSITVSLAQKKCEREGYGMYEFRVKDTGIGMTEEFAKKVFEPFEREKSETVNKIQGTGLGMSIAKNIIDMMGGTVRVETALHKGTEFIVNVELKIQEEMDEVDSSELEKLSSLKAMVVDDDFAACDGIIKSLHRFGMDAEWSMSGREALLRIKQSRELDKSYNVFIIDWQLPDLNGLEVIRQIRRISDEDIPVILMSSYSWSDIENEAEEVGVSAFCSKPIFMSDLQRTLIDVLSREAEEDKGDPLERFKGSRLLLVEDNELNREIATEILQEYDFIVEDAENGKVAVDKVAAAEAGYYDVVLMDIQMPVMDGYEATKEIRGLPDEQVAAVPILAMTANAFEEDKRNALEAGMNGHIAKPIDVNVLLEVLNETL